MMACTDFRAELVFRRQKASLWQFWQTTGRVGPRSLLVRRPQPKMKNIAPSERLQPNQRVSCQRKRAFFAGHELARRRGLQDQVGALQLCAGRRRSSSG